MDPVTGTAGALALLPLLSAHPAPEHVLAAALLIPLLGLFDFLSRSKKKEPALAPDGPNSDDAPETDLEGKGPEEGVDPEPPRGKLPGRKRKAEEPPRPRPRRSDYTGQRVSVFVPGRQAEPSARTPPQSAPKAEPAPQSPSACPGCGKPPERPGGFCLECECKNRVTDVGNLVSSLKTKEVNMLPAERHLFQARSALAVSAWKDVLRLSAQAEAAAREQDADYEEGQRILARCEEMVASAIESGRNTLSAEKAFRKATLLFKQGKYTDSMEEAVIIPTLIMDRPRPKVVMAQPPGGPAGDDGEKRDATTAPGPPPGPAGGGEPAREMVRCLSCGRGIERGAPACPSCGKPATSSEDAAWSAGRACPTCGETLDPAWNVCPGCNTPLSGNPDAPDARCPSCGREVLPTWTMCPFCDAMLRDDGGALRVKKGFSRPDRPAPAVPPAVRESGVLAQIREVDRLLEEANRRGLDVRKAKNLLELAGNFTRAGNFDKGERYVRKAKNVAETLLVHD